MKAFSTYRDGLPPTPGVFATDESVYATGEPVRIGDIILNQNSGKERGMIIGIYGPTLVYLINQADPDDKTSVFGDIFMCGMSAATVVGHVDNSLAEVARIEEEAES